MPTFDFTGWIEASMLMFDERFIYVTMREISIFTIFKVPYIRSFVA